MFFGLVTKRELDQLREELTQQVRKGQAFQQELEYEWAKWYDKFRSLYARLLKREKAAGPEGDGAGDTAAETRPVDRQAAGLQFPHSRRGF